ncbi:threonine--tRNA ligase [Candidatus Woesearchaeota archaeon]|nr:threonine--tRNA ligase [Candidatus Woesearchaeota archaeon]MCF7900962.1 threonine--tRNA ligase [Candidatus Woesearchaeota archaeon]MCF8013592.1 threonine--tRNA ligase [Candidatus Woesearchaeota archaeon]
MSDNQINIKFPDGAMKQYPLGTTGMQIASDISEGLARNAVGILVDGKTLDLTVKLTKNIEDFKILTFKDQEGQEIFRHSSAHLLAQAVTRLFPEAKLTIGPVVEEGFYYDIDHPPFKEEDLTKIETEMKKIAKEKLPVTRHEATYTEAKKIFKDNKYKIELLEEFEKENPNEKVSYYQQGEFKDLCRGPHVPNTGVLKAIKLTKLAGAYWRANAKNKQLQRIYGISYPDKKELNQYLALIEEAKKRDHRKIGKDLELYTFHEYSPGSPFFFPKGTEIYLQLMNFVREEYKKRGYEEVITPLLYDKELWETSGHWDHYKDDMFVIKVDDREFSMKPMNCPSHALMYKTKTRSYKDLPWRVADFAPLHRNELKGVLGGLTRVRKFSQDDAHIFCTEEQMQQEIFDLLDFVHYIYADIFKMEYEIGLSTRPEKAMGEPELWVKAEDALKIALNKKNMIYKINEGDGAFYGPKIDIEIKDALGRKWQLATIQLDFQMPLRFKATYEGEDGTKHTPIMIHRAILGSLERFIGILVEHYAGKFPLWISPEQVRVLIIADRHQIFADRVVEELKEAGIRVTKDYKAETLNKKIRNAQLDQVNYILVIGDKEEEQESVNVRTRDNEIHGTKKLEDFKKQLIKEIKDKK